MHYFEEKSSRPIPPRLLTDARLAWYIEKMGDLTPIELTLESEKRKTRDEETSKAT